VSRVAAQAVEMYTTTPEELTQLLTSDIARLGQVIRDAGIKAQ
jgi:tripartite-type tricarboxylate transporter receptor subunit TctC